MGRSPCCDKSKVKRGSWSQEEDAILKSYILKHGSSGNWIALPQKAGLRRCGKSCRLRWLNYLRPDIKLGAFTPNEENIICDLYKKLGSRWSVIASQLQGRTDNDVKNFWNTKLKKKLMASDIYTPPANATNPRNAPPASWPVTTPFRASTSSPTFQDPVFADKAPAGIANESSSSTISYEPANYDLPRLVLQGSSADNGWSFHQELATFRPVGFEKDDQNYVVSGVSTDDGYSCEVLSGIWPQEENIGADGNADLFSIFQF